MKKVAVILSGCGFKDGAEITEAVSTLIAITEAGGEYQCFAPDKNIESTDHVSDNPSGTRNILSESARIARGNVKPLNELNEKDFDALVFPGGFGAALHLCTWAQKGSQCEVLPDVVRVISGFNDVGKPIGAMCIAPVLLAKILGDKEITITIGADPETAQEIEKTGSQHQNCDVDDFITDRENRIVTTPAYMYDSANPNKVFKGITGLINEVIGIGMKKVALIFGGPSPEHDVSLFSAKNIYQALKETNLGILCLGVTRKGQWKLIKGDDLVQTNFEKPIHLEELGIKIDLVNEDGQIFVVSPEGSDKSGPIDVAFPIIHGPYGEDGELQKYLDQLPLKYVGSGPDSCHINIDKAVTKEVIRFTSIQQVPYIVCEDSNPEFQQVVDKLGLPFFVKPARMGSSIGISKVKSEADYHKAIADARIHDSKIVIERGVKAREVECAALQRGDDIEVVGPAEVKPHHEFYSYDAKYIDPNGAELLIPAPIDEDIAAKICATAKEAFQHLKCKDYARVDFFLTEDNQIYFNELNTHPGFTNISLFPQLWQHAGLSYKDLILHLLNQALQA